MAALLHPGVAAVYDYGQTRPDGGPTVAYIVMAWVDGQSLPTGSPKLDASVRRRPRRSSPRPAARCRPSTTPVSCTATSSRPTWWSIPTGRSSSSTSVSPSPPPSRDSPRRRGRRHRPLPGARAGGSGPPLPRHRCVRPRCRGLPLPRRTPAVPWRQRRPAGDPSPAEDPPPLPDDVRPTLRDLVATAMAEDPAHRFPTAAAMAEAAEAAVDADERPTARDRRSRSARLGSAASRPRTRRRRTAVVTLVACLIAILAALAFADPAGLLGPPSVQPDHPETTSSPNVGQTSGPGGGSGGELSTTATEPGSGPGRPVGTGSAGPAPVGTSPPDGAGGGQPTHVPTTRPTHAPGGPPSPLRRRPNLSRRRPRARRPTSTHRPSLIGRHRRTTARSARHRPPPPRHRTAGQAARQGRDDRLRVPA